MSGDFAPPTGPSEVPPRQPTVSPAGQPAVETGSRSLLRSRRGVAWAAWIAIAAGLALLIGLSWSAALAWADRGLDTASIGDTGDMHPLQLVPGMCVEEVGEDGSVDQVSVVACDEPHLAEVFTSMEFSLLRYPGDEEVQAEALDVCGSRIEGLLPGDSSWVAWAPSESSWDRGDRVALCVAVFDSPRQEPLSPAGIEATRTTEGTADGQDA